MPKSVLYSTAIAVYVQSVLPSTFTPQRSFLALLTSPVLAPL